MEDICFKGCGCLRGKEGSFIMGYWETPAKDSSIQEWLAMNEASNGNREQKEGEGHQ